MNPFILKAFYNFMGATSIGNGLYFELENFRLAPENASLDNLDGEGHAHLYLNDIKLGRLYSNWYHIPELIKSKNVLRITLNSNDHQTLVINGSPVERVITLD